MRVESDFGVVEMTSTVSAESVIFPLVHRKRMAVCRFGMWSGRLMANATVGQDRTRANGRTTKPARSVRRYRPDMESLESISLLNATLPAPDALIETDGLAAPAPAWPVPDEWVSTSANGIVTSSPGAVAGLDAWDEVLAGQRYTPSVDLLQRSADEYGESLAQSGFGRISNYLGRTWRKAGIDSPQDEDCTQSVFMVLLERWGRDRFEDVAAEVGRSGLDRLTDRQEAVGLDFLRALDQVKKQAQRQQRKTPVSLAALAEIDGQDWAEAIETLAFGQDLDEVISESLDSREADVILATIAGDSPTEIAARWGVSPKTVSNVKSEAIGKLRSSLASYFEGTPN
ncbi:hypothetical protein GC170_10090 [bacterium]|nr:hypothetical protein [bacterium]